MTETKDRNRIYEVALGGLLHDIGKFAQRARVELDDQSLGMENYLCPTNAKTNRPSHRHVLYTNHFMENCCPVWPEGLTRSEVANLASYHHKADTALREIIRQADWASAGIDRYDRDDGEEGPGFRKQALKSIFSSVCLREQDQVEPRYHSMGPLDPDSESLFPGDSPDLPEGSYERQWKAFLEDVRRLPSESPRRFLDSMAALLRRYTWCIASDTMGEPDIPLFDHLYTTSAIASALYAFHEAKGDLEDTRAIQDAERPKFRMVAGDLSGIQKFLFDLRESGARSVSKILRGRSFLLSLLSLAAVEAILDRFGLPPVCKIMDAGGRFKILLPNWDNAPDLIEDLQAEFDAYCLETFKGEVSINLALSDPLARKDFEQEHYKEFMERLSWQVECKKTRPLASALGKPEAWELGGFYDDLLKQEDCPYCGKEPAGVDEDGQRSVGPLCKWARELGRKLPRSNFLVLEDRASGEETFFGRYRPRLLERIDSRRDDGLIACFKHKKEDPFYPQLDIGNYLPVYTQEDLEGRETVEEDDGAEEGDPMTFADIAAKSEGIKMLGVYKADLDRLGTIFSRGLGKKVSISREVTLSRTLNFFFTRYLVHFLEKNHPYTYTLFSGGDDLCLLGPWHSTIRLARDFERALKRFSGGHPEVTISAGIELIHSRFPAGRGIDRAGSLLDRSKNAGRNRLTLFGHTLEWGDSLDRYLKFAEDLYESSMDTSSKINKAFLYRLLGYYGEFQRFEKNRGQEKKYPKGLLYLPHLKYDIARNIQGKEETPQTRADLKLLEPLLASYASEGELFIRHLPVAVFIALYRQRERNQKGARA